MATVTKTIGTSSRDYSTISAWEADLSEASIYSNGDDAVGEMYADSTFTDNVVTFNGGTSIGGSSGQDLNSVKLTVAAGSRHDGTAESGALLKPTAGSGGGGVMLRVARDDFTIEWLDISLDSLDATTSRGAIALNSGCGNVTIRNMLIHGVNHTANTSGPIGITSEEALTTSETWYFLNNIIYNIEKSSSNASSLAINVHAFKGTLHIYNNTIYNIKSQGAGEDAVGIRFGGGTHVQANIKNNIVAGLDEGDLAAAYWMEENPDSNRVLNSATNLSDDTADAAKDAEDFDVSKNDSSALIGKTLAQIDFVSTATGSEDLHISQSSVCIGAGTDLGTTGGVQTDINGRDRDAKGDTWDIGAHEFTAVARYASAFVMFVD